MSKASSKPVSKEWEIWKKYKELTVHELIDILNSNIDKTMQAHVAAMELQLRGGKLVLDYAKKLCTHIQYKFRTTGAFILAQVKIQDKAVLKEVENILISLGAKDKSIVVRYTAIYSLGQRYSRGLEYNNNHFDLLTTASKHSSATIREATAFALAYVKNDDILPLLENLLQDPDQDVRNWAGFAASNNEVDSVELRNVLVKMLDDTYIEARYEAIEALAKRQDKRVINSLIKELSENSYDMLIEAVVALEDSQFIPILKNLLNKYPKNEFIKNSIQALEKMQK